MIHHKLPYKQPAIIEEKVHVNFFLRGNHWLDDIEGLLFKEVYANTIYLPIIIGPPAPEPPPPDPGGGS